MISGERHSFGETQCRGVRAGPWNPAVGGEDGQRGDQDPPGAARGLDVQPGEKGVRLIEGGQSGVVQNGRQVYAAPPP